MLLERLPSLAHGRPGSSSSRIPAAHPHHLGEGPVGDAVAVGEAAPAMPPDVICGEAVDVLVELPCQARLPDPGDADHRTSVAGARSAGAWKSSLISRSSRSRRQTRPRGSRRTVPPTRPDDPEARHSVDRPALPFSSYEPRRLVLDRGIGGLHRVVADEHLAGLSERLDPGGGVHDVAGDHPLPRRRARRRPRR